MPRAIKQVAAVYQPEAECTDCEWLFGRSTSTMANVKSHVEATGHKVRVIRQTIELWALKTSGR